MDPRLAREYKDHEEKHWWFRVREQIIVRSLRSRLGRTEGLRILDVGSGGGGTSKALAALGEVTCVEPSPELYEALRQTSAFPVVHGSILDLPFGDDEFDLVCAFDVVEHVDQHEQAAAELARVCKPGGMVAITVPAFQSLWSHHDEINHHFRRYRSRQLTRLFCPPLQLRYSTYFNTLLFAPIWLFRRLSGFFPKRSGQESSGSDFSVLPHPLVSAFFYQLFALELFWLPRHSFAFGVSLLQLYSKL
ncbi:hypothetical protein ABS71_07600 [bacterium SCN 62-11]|nr:class I SAM-dependent methyltransferase [Candidatus Eremiobacteraeota bacterium]ODT72832.1 MAG: hypothetical protein ABS71_07600 [bacterium SCN 62-11]